MAGWSRLPIDPLSEVALKLDTIEDLIYFSVVCRSWNRVSSMIKQEWKPKVPTTPWLLLTEPSKNTSPRKIFSIAENKCYEYELPETFGARCWGSSYGWIVMLHLDKRIQLFNPITKAQLSLPPLQTVPGHDDAVLDEDPYDKEWFQKLFVTKFVVLKMPRKDNVDEDEFVVMLNYWFLEILAFARPGDRAWTQVLKTTRKQVSDMICWDGLVLILYRDGALAYCDITRISETDNSGVASVLAKDYLPPTEIFEHIMKRELSKLYMVELGGNLLVVARDNRSLEDENGKPSYRTRGFEVYKLDCNTKLWEERKDLGDFLLFVGNNTCESVHITKATNCQRNAIYFVDDANKYWDQDATRGHDMGVYNMASREIKLFYEGDDTISKPSAPAWFMPKF